MDDEAQLLLIRHGKQLTASDVVIITEYLKFVRLPILTGSKSLSSKGRRPPPLDEDCNYLVNLSGPVMEEELTILAHYG